jgi:hypothetical protein
MACKGLFLLTGIRLLALSSLLMLVRELHELLEGNCG